VKEAKTDLVFRNYKEEWVSGDDGLVHELSVELQATE
jgi:hypothetical protein